MPVRYRPDERAQLEYIQQFVGSHPRAGDDLMGMFLGTIGGAQERFEQNRQTRQEGLQGLREMALQLAASGASEEALTSALTGQAEALPLMGGPGGQKRLGGLEDFVSGLYGEGPVSGLAPAEMRGFSGTIDDQDRQMIAGQVNQQMSQGVPFKDIRELVRRDFIAQGYDEFSTSEAVQEAQSAYERLLGTSLGEMRSTGSALRSYAGGNEFEMGHLANLGLDQSEFEPYVGGGNVGVEGFLAQLANDPRLMAQLAQALEDYQPDTRSLFDKTIGGLFGPSSGMPFGT